MIAEGRNFVEEPKAKGNTRPDGKGSAFAAAYSVKSPAARPAARWDCLCQQGNAALTIRWRGQLR